MSDRTPVTLHATAVAFGKSGLLITGRSGAGKSTLAIELISRGAILVSDDRVVCKPLLEGGLRLSSPAALKGRIEARNIGILTTPSKDALAVAVVDLDTVETQRLPNPKQIVIAGERLQLLSKVESPAFAAMLQLTFGANSENG